MSKPGAHHHKYLVIVCPDGRERHFSTIGATLESPYSKNVPLSALLHLWEHGGAIRHEETGTVVRVSVARA